MVGAGGAVATGAAGAVAAGAGVEGVAGAVVAEPGAAVAAGAAGSWISTGVGAGAITVGESGTGATGRRGRPGRGRNRPVWVAFVSALAAEVFWLRMPVSARAIASSTAEVRPLSDVLRPLRRANESRAGWWNATPLRTDPSKRTWGAACAAGAATAGAATAAIASGRTVLRCMCTLRRSFTRRR